MDMTEAEKLYRKRMDMLDKMGDKLMITTFPASYNKGWHDVDASESHEDGKSHHPLVTRELETVIDGYRVIYKQNECKKCKEVKNRNATVFDGNTVKTVWWIKKGEILNRGV